MEALQNFKSWLIQLFGFYNFTAIAQLYPLVIVLPGGVEELFMQFLGFWGVFSAMSVTALTLTDLRYDVGWIRTHAPTQRMFVYGWLELVLMWYLGADFTFWWVAIPTTMWDVSRAMKRIAKRHREWAADGHAELLRQAFLRGENGG